MKAAKVEVKINDFRVWCEYCSIRIAPHEQQIVAEGKTYHERCHSKHFVPSAKAKVKAVQNG